MINVSEGDSKDNLKEILNNTYYKANDRDREGLLKTSTDSIARTRTEYNYNSFKQPTATNVYNLENNSLLNRASIEYGEYGEVKKQKIVADTYSQEYNYYYKDTLNKELDRIAMPYGLNGKSERDMNGRITEQILSNSNTNIGGAYYTYLKKGDPCNKFY